MGRECKNTVLIDRHERYVQHCPKSNHAVTIKQHRVTTLLHIFYGTAHRITFDQKEKALSIFMATG